MEEATTSKARDLMDGEVLGIDSIKSAKGTLEVGALIVDTIPATTNQFLGPLTAENPNMVLEGNLTPLNFGKPTTISQPTPSNTRKKNTSKTITYAYATRSKKGIIIQNREVSQQKKEDKGKKIISGRNEAQRSLSYAQALGIKAYVKDDLVIEQCQALDDELNQRVLFDSESEEDYVDLDDDITPAQEENSLPCQSHI